MNYGQKFRHIIIAAVGMVILITGLAFKTGYIPGHSQAGSIALLLAGTVITIIGLMKMKDD